MKNPFKRTSTEDVADVCERAASGTDDPETAEQYRLGAQLAQQGLVPPHIKGSTAGGKKSRRRG
ncbi:hypothetical protein [Streptomyces violaceusniger]|uniref:Uncharacterized protein n=1 Tax=Streptomyces violaceusniger (strain Tu 4113) TaxID=653045 RepID=G2P7B4_STRV4|nr:hypothetical protein [Streptomyces violaceusniger]AEM87074.1 hypothetical protein Strvi_7739 [Streptomyces violaceusniger Tu 4113]